MSDEQPRKKFKRQGNKLHPHSYHGAFSKSNLVHTPLSGKMYLRYRLGRFDLCFFYTGCVNEYSALKYFPHRIESLGSRRQLFKANVNRILLAIA